MKNQAARRFVDAVNAGDTDQVLAALTDDAVVIDSGRRFADSTAIRNWLDTEVTGIDGRITVNSEQTTADGVVLIVDFRSSGFNGTDLRYAFITRGDRVASLTLG
jgi:ketosteroid isomerase-like protein